ncbi:MAG: hypothetical protein GAK35_00270 [Herbaspirillum frisingense]|uniref:Uncharacterized protein n=1 Tax=Herbaspirillum frisingense TaxID=92645 RepID=A0A7V8JW90_9BURK|nr:MAG: hypothetical protein GAK35_00270 [Herbaspirillum frisingense]
MAGLAGGEAAAATGYYLVNVYSDPGQWTLDYKYWNAKRPGSPPVGSPELGIGYGVNARWYTEIYGVTAQTAAQGTRFVSWNWQNDVLLTQGEYPFDLALHTDIEQYRARDGYGLEWGPALQTEWWRTQFNLNLFFQRDYRVSGGDPTELVYQWQVRQHWRPLFNFGLQGFGELGRWDRWDRREDQSHRLGPAIFGTAYFGKQFLKYEAAYLIGTNNARSARSVTMRLQLGF